MADKIKRGANKEIGEKDLKKGIEDIENLEADRRSAKAAHAKRDASKQDVIAAKKDALQEKGANLVVLNTALEVRSLQGKIQDARNKLEPSQRDLFDRYMKVASAVKIMETVPVNNGKGEGKGASAESEQGALH